MAINKVIYQGNVLVDLTEDTVTPETLIKGTIAHAKNGEVIVGVAQSSDFKLQEKEATGNGVVLPDEGYDGLSKVTVNAPSSLKKLLDARQNANYLFSTSEAMYGSGKELTYETISEIFDYDATENCTHFKQMFGGNTYITKIPLFNTNKARDLGGFCNGCSSLTEVPVLDYSNVESMIAAFQLCSKLTNIPKNLSFNKLQSANQMFYSCSALEGEADFRNISVLNSGKSMFYGCKKLVTAKFNPSCKFMESSSMFYDCSSLTTVENLNIGSVGGSNVSGMFTNCSSLTNLKLKNIVGNLTVGSGTSYGHLLTMESLLNLFNETIYYSSGSHKLTIGSENLAKLTGEYEYVRPTGVYLDRNDNVVEELTHYETKIPVVWCSSTDEGAMTVSAYMSSKGWSIA
jgi:hypothetical protein